MFFSSLCSGATALALGSLVATVAGRAAYASFRAGREAAKEAAKAQTQVTSSFWSTLGKSIVKNWTAVSMVGGGALAIAGLVLYMTGNEAWGRALMSIGLGIFEFAVGWRTGAAIKKTTGLLKKNIGTVLKNWGKLGAKGLRGRAVFKLLRNLSSVAAAIANAAVAAVGLIALNMLFLKEVWGANISSDSIKTMGSVFLMAVVVRAIPLFAGSPTTSLIARQSHWSIRVLHRVGATLSFVGATAAIIGVAMMQSSDLQLRNFGEMLMTLGMIAFVAGFAMRIVAGWNIARTLTSAGMAKATPPLDIGTKVGAALGNYFKAFDFKMIWQQMRGLFGGAFQCRFGCLANRIWRYGTAYVSNL